MQTVKLQRTANIIRILFVIALVPLSLAALFRFLYYKLLAITVGILFVLWLTSRLRRSRHSVSKYRWLALIGVVTLCAALIVSPEFNFWLTYPARQQAVTRFVETYESPQYDVPMTTLLLGKTNGNIGPDSDNVTVYFRYYGVLPRSVGERAYIIYTTRPIAKIEVTLYADRDATKQLKANWFLIKTKSIGFD